MDAARGVRLVLVTDRRLMGGEAGFAAAIDRALAALPPGAALVQVREKDLDGRALVALARAAVAAAHRRGARVIVNGRADVARAAGADGVHLPEDGLTVAEARGLVGPGAIVGVSRHAVAGAGAAAAAGADLIVVGPIWATPSKAPFGAPLGPDLLGAARAAIAAAAPAGAPPVLAAIGGVDDPDRAGAARAAGADAVAAIRAIWSAADPAAAARALADAPLANPRGLR